MIGCEVNNDLYSILMSSSYKIVEVGPIAEVFLDSFEIAALVAVYEAVGLPPPSGMLMFRLSTGGEIQIAVTPIPAR